MLSNMDRISWNEYFMRMVEIVAERSTCIRRKVGAIAVKDNRILATGYNGVPSNITHCEVVGCLREQLNIPSGERHDICRAIHGEQNVIVQCAKYGVSLDGATLYCTTFPCSICAKMLINVGIKEIYYTNHYPDDMSELMLQEAGVKLHHYTNSK